jgi:hypothetical protein
MRSKYRARKRVGSGCNHGEWILEQARTYLEHLELKIEELGCQACRVNSGVSCTVTKSVVVGLLVFFQVTSSLEFPTERFLATFARETMINK